MKEIKTCSRFRKDMKRYVNQPTKVEKLYAIVSLLQRDEPIPKENKPHQLSGKYAGHWECHIEDDFLLIWIDEEANVVKLVRLGSHSALFKR